MRQVGVVGLLVNASNIRVNVSAVTQLCLVFYRNRTLPFDREIGRLDLYVARVLSERDCETLRSVRIIVSARALRCRRENNSATRTRLYKRILLRRLFCRFSARFNLTRVRRHLVPFKFCRVARFVCCVSFVISCFAICLAFALRECGFVVGLRTFFRGVSRGSDVF